YAGENGAAGSGIYTNQASGVQIEGNFIGTDVSGKAPLGNALDGVKVTFAYYPADFFIGGTAPGAGNVISCNHDSGIEIGESLHVKVQGNLIGTDISGSV